MRHSKKKKKKVGARWNYETNGVMECKLEKDKTNGVMECKLEKDKTNGVMECQLEKDKTNSGPNGVPVGEGQRGGA